MRKKNPSKNAAKTRVGDTMCPGVINTAYGGHLRGYRSEIGPKLVHNWPEIDPKFVHNWSTISMLFRLLVFFLGNSHAISYVFSFDRFAIFRVVLFVSLLSSGVGFV